MQTNLQIRVFSCGPFATNAYLITSAVLKSVILIDAPLGISSIILKILASEGLHLEAIILTHGHWDHIAEAESLRMATQAPIYAHAGDRVFFATPEIMSFSIPDGLTVPPVSVTHYVEQGEILRLLNESFEVRHVPGHAPGNILLYHPELGAFVGDSLFRRSVGRTDLPLASSDNLLSSIREQIYTLPPETVVYPGHGSATSVQEESLYNPYCRK